MTYAELTARYRGATFCGMAAARLAASRLNGMAGEPIWTHQRDAVGRWIVRRVTLQDFRPVTLADVRQRMRQRGAR